MDNLDKEKLLIVIISNEAWGEIWFSKHHYANELTKLGYRVYFCNPPIKWKFQNLFSFKITIDKTPEGVSIINYHNNFPLKVLPRFFLWLNDKLNQKKISQHLPEEKCILWQFDPFRFVYFNTKRFSRIYHVSDPYIHLPYDNFITKNSALIVCTSPNYIPYYKNRHQRVIQVPHGIPSDEGLVDPAEVNKISDQYGEFVLLVGSINDTVNIDLIEAISNDGYTLLVIGKNRLTESNKVQSWDKLIQHNKISFLGPKHSTVLKHYIKASKVCITAYEFNLKKSVGTGSPLKILHYLAQYKPVITSIDSEIEMLEGKAIYRAYNINNFLDLLKKGMNDYLEVNTEEIHTYLISHQYPILINQILAHLCI